MLWLKKKSCGKLATGKGEGTYRPHIGTKPEMRKKKKEKESGTWAKKSHHKITRDRTPC